jgi:hypothetical protein
MLLHLVAAQQLVAHMCLLCIATPLRKIDWLIQNAIPHYLKLATFRVLFLT